MDETTPLVHNGYHPTRSKIPVLQIFILLLVQFSEPITSSVINPFVNQLVNETGITKGHFGNVGYYVGLIESIFFITEAIMTMHWGRLSDAIGRKPIMLIGTIGLASSMICFGLSRTFWALIASRALSGALNGNIGVTRAMLGEICDPQSMAAVIPYLSIVWEVGLSVGPLLGGSLARPYDRFGGPFKSIFWKIHPYFLPCIAAASCSIIAFILGLFFLKETLPQRTRMSCPSFLRTEVSSNTLSDSASDHIFSSESFVSRSDEPEPERHTTYSLLVLMKAVFINYGLLSLTDIAFIVLQTLVYATPVDLGGLGLTPAEIGYILGATGFSNTICQLTLYEKLHRQFGAKRLFTVGVGCYGIVFLLFPIMNGLARGGTTYTENGSQTLAPAVWVLVVIQCAMIAPISMSWGSIFLIINTASPISSLGAANGLAQTTASVMRAIGPAGVTSLFALTINQNLLGGWLVYDFMILVVLIDLYMAKFLPSDVPTELLAS